ncbi:MAG: S53 family peptidase [Nocardioidaceae bacterium]
MPHRWSHSRGLKSGRATVTAAAAGLLVAGLIPLQLSTASAAPTPAQAAKPAATRSAGVSHSTSSTAHPLSSHVVTLITGDRVRLTRWSNGKTVSTIVKGSPSYGKPIQTIHTVNGDYVVPRLPVREMRKLSYSLFNVTKLSKLTRPNGSVPLQVTFAKGVQPHALPGVRVDAEQAKVRASGTTTRATYTTGSQDLRRTLGKAWKNVTSVSLPDSQPKLGPAYDLQTLTVAVNNPKGAPVRFTELWVQNVDDSRLFTFPLPVVNGSVKVAVPAGHYSIMAGGFRWMAISPDLTVSADTSVTLNAAQATVRPAEHVGTGKISVDAQTTLIRQDNRHGSFAWGIESNRFGWALPRVPATLPQGSFVTLTQATLADKGKGRKASDGFSMVYPRLIFTKDMVRGVPASLDYHHSPAAFAKLTSRFYANGPAQLSFYGAYGIAPGEFFLSIAGLPTEFPSQLTVWLQGNSHLRWLQFATGIEQLHPPFNYAEMDAPLTTYMPGVVTHPLNFFRGPVGPGYETGINSAAGCLLCRRGDALHGYLPLWSSSGSHLTGYMYNRDMGSWSLSRGRRSLQHGADAIAPDPRQLLPSAPTAYRLSATVHPGSWRLSTSVTDTWRFVSQTSNAAIPLLIPSYVPPTNLSGYVKQGRVHFRLNFENIGPVSARVARASLQFSTNKGRVWQRARLTRVDKNSFRVTYINPARSMVKRFVSLRARGTDAAGRTVTETALNAYRLYQPKVRHSKVVSKFPGKAAGARPACSSRGISTYTCFAMIEASGRKALLTNGDPAGWGATDIRSAYGLTGLPSAPQKVAVVVAGNYPSAEADMNTYRRQYGLPPCTSASGCFKKINQDGQTSHYPYADQGWALEAALDLQMISTSCPNCQIVLAEANQPLDASLDKATDAAVAAGAKVTNHSYGIQEYNGVTRNNRHYNRTGVTAVSATGDYGYGPASFPASSPDVVAVGGTVLHHADNARGWSERAWQFAASGCSGYFAKPSWQTDPSCHMRSFADLSAVADGVAVFDSFGIGGQKGWFLVGGTSVSSPLVAGMIAAAGAGGMKPGALYGRAADFHDIIRGTNGFCQQSYICTAKAGYDGPTGWGSPRGLTPFQ